MAKKEELSFQAWAADFCLGGVAGAVSKTFTAPIERVKLLCVTNDLCLSCSFGCPPEQSLQNCAWVDCGKKPHSIQR